MLTKSVLLFSLILIPKFAFAGVIISEVMYDVDGSDSGREWIELTNQGDIAENIEGWRLFEQGVNHTLKIISGSFDLQANQALVIVSDPEKFLIDWPEYSGTLIDSSFSLSNSGESITIRDSDLNDIDSFVYTGEEGANGDGNSLYKIDNEIKVGAPTPGLAGYADAVYQNDGGSDSNLDTSASAHSNPEPISFAKEINSIVVNPGRDRISLVGTPVVFETRAINEDNKKEYVDGVSYEWSLGDGSSQSGRKIEHIYREPGDYVVVVRAKFREDIAVSRTKIKVYPFDVEVSDVEPSQYVELKNNLNVEANIGGSWLSNGNAVFQIAPDTIILPKTKIKIPREVLVIDISNEVLFRDPSGFLVSSYKPIIKTGEVLGAVYQPPTKTQPVVVIEDSKPNTQGTWFIDKENVIDINQGNSKGMSTSNERVEKLNAEKVVLTKEKIGFWNKTFRFFKNIF